MAQILLYISSQLYILANVSMPGYHYYNSDSKLTVMLKWIVDDFIKKQGWVVPIYFKLSDLVAWSYGG